MEIEVGDDARRVVLAGGRLLGAVDQLVLPDPADPDHDDPDPDRPLPRHLLDELSCVASWLDAESRRVRLVHCDGAWSVPFPRLPRFEPVATRSRSRG
jgi:hypothetical protein